MADIPYPVARRLLKGLVNEAVARRSDQFYLSPHYDVEHLADDAVRIFVNQTG